MKYLIFLLIFIPSTLLALPVPPPESVTKMLWTPPTENTDGSTLTDLAGFNTYCSLDENSIQISAAQYRGESLANETEQLLSDLGTGTQAVALNAGTWFCKMTAFTLTSESNLSVDAGEFTKHADGAFTRPFGLKPSVPGSLFIL